MLPPGGRRLPRSTNGSATPSSASSWVRRPAEPFPSAATTTRKPSASSSRSCFASRAASPITGSQPLAATTAVPGPSGAVAIVRTGASVCVSRRSKGRCSRGQPPLADFDARVAPHVCARLAASAASSSSSSAARSRMRRGSTSATSASRPTRSNNTCSPSVSHGSHDSMPSNVAPSASRSHCSRPHGSARTSRAARSRTSSVGNSSRHGNSSTRSTSRVDR